MLFDEHRENFPFLIRARGAVFKVRGAVTTSFAVGGGRREGALLIVTNSKFICYVGNAQLSVLYLWLFRTVRLLNLS